jgi:hypothetical protein
MRSGRSGKYPGIKHYTPGCNNFQVTFLQKYKTKLERRTNLRIIRKEPDAAGVCPRFPHEKAARAV